MEETRNMFANGEEKPLHYSTAGNSWRKIVSADYSTWAHNPEDGNSMFVRNDGTYLRSVSAPTPKNKVVFIVTPMRTSNLTCELELG
jgi:hypothetical protein